MLHRATLIITHTMPAELGFYDAPPVSDVVAKDRAKRAEENMVSVIAFCTTCFLKSWPRELCNVARAYVAIQLLFCPMV